MSNIIGKLFQAASPNPLHQSIKSILGVRTRSLDLYIKAFTHSSFVEGGENNNERLEYLGDAVISSIVADYLYKRYPLKGEGFLTEMRSKMVNRQQLNEVALKMGFKEVTLFNRNDNSLKKSQIFGNTLEAVVGAIYLDKGYKYTQKWVMKKIVLPHMFVDDLEQIDINLKNRIIGWASKHNKVLNFELVDENPSSGRKSFLMQVVVDGEIVGEGRAFTKKDASQIAAQVAIKKLGIQQTEKN